MIDYKFLMNFLKNPCSDHNMQIYAHTIKPINYQSPCNRILGIDLCYFLLWLCSAIELCFRGLWLLSMIPLSYCRNITYLKVRCASVALWNASKTYDKFQECCTFFKATICFSLRSTAFHTIPYAPFPNF